SSTPQADGAPLLAGLPFGPGASDDNVPWAAREALLLEKYSDSLAAGGGPIELTRDDLRRFTGEGHPALPDAMFVMATILAESVEACRKGDFQLRVSSAFGPSGARMFGRFCHLSVELTQAVEAHLRAEEAHRPDAVFAEVVHLPNGRVGNILFRPLLRRHEIP